MTYPEPSEVGAVLYGDCDSDTQQWAIQRLRRQPLACFTEAVSVPSWQRIPSTYFICQQDGAMPVEIQRTVFAPRTGQQVELNTSHSPFLSQPRLLAEQLAQQVFGRA
jgi:hypothetical protein